MFKFIDGIFELIAVYIGWLMTFLALTITLAYAYHHYPTATIWIGRVIAVLLVLGLIGWLLENLFHLDLSRKSNNTNRPSIKQAFLAGYHNAKKSSH